MVTTPRSAPPLEVQIQREYLSEVGMGLKALSDKKKAEKERQENEKRISIPRTEHWYYKKIKTNVPVEVRRNKKGQFLKPLKSKELAEHFGLMMGREVPPPRRRRKA